MTHNNTSAAAGAGVIQADTNAANEWRGILEYHADYDGDAIADLAQAFARHRILALESSRPPVAGSGFQDRVAPWMQECFGEKISRDLIERTDRATEEMLELSQAICADIGVDFAPRAHALVDYVAGRPAGEPSQEVGGVMVTLAALCLAAGLDMHGDGETELARISRPEIVAKIRAKQAAKPTGSALPIAALATPEPPALEAGRIAEVLDEEAGVWRPCTGCQESVDGCVSVRDYPYNAAFRCQPGSGCRECGGIGVIWDTTDYEDMARFMLADDADEALRPNAEGWREMERRAVARCIEVVRETRDGFLSPEYATDQPMSSFQERFACDQAAEAIENEFGLGTIEQCKLLGKPTPFEQFKDTHDATA